MCSKQDFLWDYPTATATLVKTRRPLSHGRDRIVRHAIHEGFRESALLFRYQVPVLLRRTLPEIVWLVKPAVLARLAHEVGQGRGAPEGPCLSFDRA